MLSSCLTASAGGRPLQSALEPRKLCLTWCRRAALQVAGKRFERSLHTLQRQEHPPCAECSAGFKARNGVDAAVYHGAACQSPCKQCM